jgi:predicted signal transduction protein with EAL and GGDEF domain
MLVSSPPSASPLLGLGFCGDPFCSASSIPSSESRAVGWGGQNKLLPCSGVFWTADDFQLQSLLLIYFSLWLLIFEEQGHACSVGNIAFFTCCFVVVEPNHCVFCLAFTPAVLAII